MPVLDTESRSPLLDPYRFLRSLLDKRLRESGIKMKPVDPGFCIRVYHAYLCRTKTLPQLREDAR
jgi:hypothetical protein